MVRSGVRAGPTQCALRAGMVSFKEFLFALVGWVLEEDAEEAVPGGEAVARSEAATAAAAAATALSRQAGGLRPARRLGKSELATSARPV